MKNKIKQLLTILVVTAGCLMFASFSPSLDGRAVVVDKGVFPQGLFAKTVGYLPGDIISVTNIAGDTTIDLLVIGALDPSEGVAIMLSPEAADAMGIDKTANNIVKITKRSGQDERVYGNAIISKSAAEIEDYDDGTFENISAEENTEAFDDNTTLTEADVSEDEAFEETEENPEDESTVSEEDDFTEDFEENYEEDFAEEDEAFADEAVEEEDSFEEETFDDEAVEENVEEEELDTAEEETSEEEFEEEEAEATEEEPEAEEFTDEAPEELEETPEEEAFDADELNELPAEEEALEEESEAETEEEPAEELEEEAFEEETPPEDIPEEESYDEEAFFDEKPEDLPVEEAEEEESLPIEEETEDEAPAEEAFDEEALEALPEESEESETDSDEYEAIVLVPVDSNPPESSDSDEVEDVISDTDIDEIDEELNFSNSTINSSITNISPVSPVETKPAAGNETSYDKYIVPSLKDLESGKYYIQIAVYGSDENILDVINTYGNNYPITIVPMAGGKTKQVLVGPVTMDEYKVVLERFKSYGFKDAFLRKVR